MMFLVRSIAAISHADGFPGSLVDNAGLSSANTAQEPGGTVMRSAGLADVVSLPQIDLIFKTSSCHRLSPRKRMVESLVDWRCATSVRTRTSSADLAQKLTLLPVAVNLIPVLVLGAHCLTPLHRKFPAVS
jgi:hypothetical protein